jgi:hypothetical protein
MRKPMLTGKLMLLFTLTFSVVAWGGSVTGIVDSNTIRVLQEGVTQGIQVSGLGSPEQYRSVGKDVKQFADSSVTDNKNQKSKEIYHGNVKSKVFHGPGCMHYSCKNCVANFKSREEAVKAGYRPCMVCNP